MYDALSLGITVSLPLIGKSYDGEAACKHGLPAIYMCRVSSGTEQ
jgi:hypothetical protein